MPWLVIETKVEAQSVNGSCVLDETKRPPRTLSVSIGATRMDGGPWSEPQLLCVRIDGMQIDGSAQVAGDEWPRIRETIDQGFAEYALRFESR